MINTQDILDAVESNVATAAEAVSEKVEEGVEALSAFMGLSDEVTATEEDAADADAMDDEDEEDDEENDEAEEDDKEEDDAADEEEDDLDGEEDDADASATAETV